VSYNIWNRFEAMLAKHAAALLGALRPPASMAQIHSVEAAVECELPDDVRAAYMRHNGSISAEQLRSNASVLFGSLCWWASLEEVVTHHRSWLECLDDALQNTERVYVLPPCEPFWDDLKIRPGWYDKQRIPVGVSNTMNSVFVDMNPAPKGTIGQLLADTGMGEPVLIAEGFNHFLEMLIERVERGVLVFREGWMWADINEPVYDWNRVI
jgi:cell wall assembly regulator SMI1